MTNKKRARKRRQRYIRRRGKVKPRKIMVTNIENGERKKDSFFRSIARFLGELKEKITWSHRTGV